MQLEFSIQWLRIEVTYWKNEAHFFQVALILFLGGYTLAEVAAFR